MNTTSRSAHGCEKRGLVSQLQFDKAISCIACLAERLKARAAVYVANRELSCGSGRLNGVGINVSGADFAQADLSGTEANHVLVRYCSFNGAKLDGCAGDNRSLRLPTCAERRPKGLNGGIQVAVAPQRVCLPVPPYCLKRCRSH